MMDDISKDQAISHEGERRQKYSMEFKKATIKYAQENSIHSAAKKFKFDRKTVRECVQKEKKVTSMKGKRFRVDGGGWKLTDVELEEEVLSWIQQRGSNMLRVSRKLIMFKAKSIYNEKYGDSEELKAGFVASNGWFPKFMKWNNLSIRRRTTIAQKDLSHLTTKFVKYVMHLRRLSMKTNFSPDCIIAMDETAVWSDIVGNVTVDTTGTKDVPLKSTGNEKVKVSVCLTAKLKPFIVFQGAKREATVLNEEFKNRCVVASSSNGWMNEELVLKLLRQVLEMFSFKKRLFAWDTFEAHMTEYARKLLKHENR